MVRQSVRRRGSSTRRNGSGGGGGGDHYTPEAQSSMIVERPGQVPSMLRGNSVAIRSSSRLSAFQLEKTKARSRSDRGGLQFPITETPYDKFFYTIRVRSQAGWVPKAVVLLHASRLEELDLDQPETCWMPLLSDEAMALSPSGRRFAEPGLRRIRRLAERNDEVTGCFEVDLRLQEMDKVGGITNTRTLLSDRKRDQVRLAVVLVHARNSHEHWVLSSGFLLKTKWGTQKGASIRHQQVSKEPVKKLLALPLSSERKSLGSRHCRSTASMGNALNDRKRKNLDEDTKKCDQAQSLRKKIRCSHVKRVEVLPCPRPEEQDLGNQIDFDFNFKDDPLFADLVYTPVYSTPTIDTRNSKERMKVWGTCSNNELGELIDLGPKVDGISKAEVQETKLGSEGADKTIADSESKPFMLQRYHQNERSPYDQYLNPVKLDPETDVKPCQTLLWLDYPCIIGDSGTYLFPPDSNPPGFFGAEQDLDLKPVLLLPNVEDFFQDLDLDRLLDDPIRT